MSPRTSKLALATYKGWCVVTSSRAADSGCQDKYVLKQVMSLGTMAGGKEQQARAHGREW